MPVTGSCKTKKKHFASIDVASIDAKLRFFFFPFLDTPGNRGFRRYGEDSRLSCVSGPFRSGGGGKAGAELDRQASLLLSLRIVSLYGLGLNVISLVYSIHPAKKREDALRNKEID